jgi:flagellin-like hook-associated protein FlgL
MNSSSIQQVRSEGSLSGREWQNTKYDMPLNRVESSDQMMGSERSKAGVRTNRIETKAWGSTLFLHSK